MLGAQRDDGSAGPAADAAPLRIVSHFTDIGPAAGGVPRSTLEIARLLAAGGHRYTVLTAAGCQPPPLWRLADQILPEIVELEPPRSWSERLSRGGLERVEGHLREADLLVLHGMWRPRNSQLAALARRLGLPYLMLAHGALDEWPMSQNALRKRVYYRLFERRNLAGAARVIATSEAELEQVRPWVPHDRISILPLPFSPALALQAGEPEPRGSQAPDGAAGRLEVLFLSRLHRKKGAHILIEALALLRRRGLDCRLSISGAGESGYVERLERLVEERGVADRTRFLGWVDGRDKLSLYKRADVMALPTSQENFGRVLIEALLCRTPVVTTRAAGLWRQIGEAGCGLLVERTPEAFAEALAELHADGARRRRMGEAGREYVLRWLDDRRLIGRYEAVLRRALAGAST